MDIFKLKVPGEEEHLSDGEIINDIREKLWVERYREAGEFKLVAPISTGIREKLPIGSFVSHIQTQEVMIVEDHQIDEEVDKDSDIVITGRGYETFLENRVVGFNNVSATDPSLGYMLPADTTWEQVKTLLEEHTQLVGIFDPDNVVPSLTIMNTVTGTGEEVERVIEKGPLYTRMVELLKIDALGVKVIRPNYLSPLGPLHNDFVMMIHVGEDKTSDTAFSYNDGDIRKAKYFWSSRAKKNCAYVTGRWIQFIEGTTESHFGRRMMHIDASDIDSPSTTNPVGTARAWLTAAMRNRARLALAAQNTIALADVEISDNEVSAIYRVDYNVGDLVGVSGNYDESAVMRVMEFAEVEDETGQTGYPTLSAINEEA